MFLRHSRARVAGLTSPIPRTRHALPNLQFEIGDAVHLPCANGAFAASLSQLGLTFLNDPEQVAAEMVRDHASGRRRCCARWDFSRRTNLSADTSWDTAAALDPQADAFASDSFEFAQHAERLKELWYGRLHKDPEAGITNNLHELRQFRRLLEALTWRARSGRRLLSFSTQWTARSSSPPRSSSLPSSHFVASLAQTPFGRP